MEKIIAELERSETEKLVIQAKEFKGRNYIDFRIYFLADEDQWRPTQKGVTVSPKVWPDFKQAVEEAETLLKAENLL
ncbi:MAG: transcriptional coactivator p15/PC4 family protein [Candidatus Marinimicrobia bacterium]|nr:transcriptional coactivator p15/PC4 family protein [Candidatus Neomarinimicrobiota bacterium]MCF7840461.1 transcriptional coactivator p15/PC4 family protein [Candidatus Neomarinimicrobiota bacterium]MCF7903262.1 transcriptional coactivator p15/PC4 family protein [Candidatus Neomarinimicrobiota bacterium]